MSRWVSCGASGCRASSPCRVRLPREEIFRLTRAVRGFSGGIAASAKCSHWWRSRLVRDARGRSAVSPSPVRPSQAERRRLARDASGCRASSPKPSNRPHPDRSRLVKAARVRNASRPSSASWRQCDRSRLVRAVMCRRQAKPELVTPSQPWRLRHVSEDDKGGKASTPASVKCSQSARLSLLRAPRVCSASKPLPVKQGSRRRPRRVRAVRLAKGPNPRSPIRHGPQMSRLLRPIKGRSVSRSLLQRSGQSCIARQTRAGILCCHVGGSLC
mmetsp:Transcript_4629/g.12877  ORF Transcript_4629/g.12877 Transcript_4629/m.12877 type:complete len:272 (+) Transcript_4629:1387-2202(+)